MSERAYYDEDPVSEDDAKAHEEFMKRPWYSRWLGYLYVVGVLAAAVLAVLAGQAYRQLTGPARLNLALLVFLIMYRFVGVLLWHVGGDFLPSMVWMVALTAYLYVPGPRLARCVVPGPVFAVFLFLAEAVFNGGLLLLDTNMSMRILTAFILICCKLGLTSHLFSLLVIGACVFLAYFFGTWYITPLVVLLITMGVVHTPSYTAAAFLPTGHDPLHIMEKMGDPQFQESLLEQFAELGSLEREQLFLQLKVLKELYEKELGFTVNFDADDGDDPPGPGDDSRSRSGSGGGGSSGAAAGGARPKFRKGKKRK